MDFIKCRPFSNYEVSECGAVRNIETGKILKSHINSAGYPRVTLYNAVGTPKHILVHKLVYSMWVGKIPANMVVDHIDDDKLNHHASNLQLLTEAENLSKKAGNVDIFVKHPSGLTYHITGTVGDFARRHGLPSNNFNKMLKGKRKSCLGWTLV